MVSGTSGAKGSISKRDPGAPQRRYRVMYTLLMQAVVAVIVLILAWFSRDDARAMLRTLAALVVPLVWGPAIYVAWQREEKARRDGRWDAAMAKKEANRTMALLALSLVGAIALMIVFTVA